MSVNVRLSMDHSNLRIFMTELTKVTDIKSKVGFCIDMGSFLMNEVTDRSRGQKRGWIVGKMAPQPLFRTNIRLAVLLHLSVLDRDSRCK